MSRGPWNCESASPSLDAAGPRTSSAELVAIRSVADPRQYPPEECERAAQWVSTRSPSVGFPDVRLAETADGSKAVVGHAPGPDRGADRAAVRPLRRAAAARRGRLAHRRSSSSPRSTAAGTAAARPTARATSSCTSRRCGRSSETDGGFPCDLKLICEGSEEQGTGGLEDFVPENADLLRADAILVCDTGNAPSACRP